MNEEPQNQENSSAEENIKGTPADKKIPPKAGVVSRSIHLFEDIMNESNQAAGRFKNGIFKTIRIIYASIDKFIRDEAFLRGSSISYALVVSFIPTLVVLLLVGGKLIDREEYFNMAREFVKQNNIPLDLTPYFEIINELLNNAAAIGGIGLLVMLFSATSVLRNVEDSLNKIWRVSYTRPIIQKISGFLMVLVFGPILLITGISVAQSLLNKFESPDLKAIRLHNDQINVVGDKHVIIERGGKRNWKDQGILNQVDYHAQKDPLLYHTGEKRIVTGQEYMDKYLPKVQRVTKGELASAEFVDFYFNGEQKWLISHDGTLLIYNSIGKIWDVQKFQKFDVKVSDIQFNKMLYLSEKEVLIIANDGLVLKTEDGGETWRIQNVTADTDDLTGIVRMPDDRFLITANGFNAYVSKDRGYSWEEFKEVTSLRTKEKENLHSATFYKDHGIIVGQFSTYLESFDKGKSWARRQVGLRGIDFQKAVFLDENTGILIGEKGLIRISRDQGKSWRGVDLQSEIDLVDLHYDQVTKKMYIIGDKYSVVTNRDDTFEKFSVIISSPWWRKLISATGNFILPFSVIWILFFLVYKIMPFTVVTTKAAAIGAAVTSTLWVVFIMLFKIYLQSFTGGTLAIYGTLAAIPLALLLIYTSSLIMLYGAEISYFIQYPGMIRLNTKGWKIEQDKRQIWYGMEMLHLIYSNFENASGPTKLSKLVKVCNNDQEETKFLLDKMLNEKIIIQVEEGYYTPLVDAETVSIEKLVEILNLSDFTVPPGKNGAFANKVRKLFESVENFKSEKFHKMTFKQFLDK